MILLQTKNNILENQNIFLKAHNNFATAVDAHHLFLQCTPSA